METPQKDNECEKQIMAAVHSEENQKRNLVTEFAQWRRKIKPLYETLGKVPDDPIFEKLIFDGVENGTTELNIDAEKIWKCQEIYDELSKQICTQKVAALELWKEVQALWHELDQNEEVGLCFSNVEASIFKALTDLKAQYSTRKIDKSRRLQEFIYELRKEISDIWEQCRITEEEKKQFIEFESCEFTEDMLRIHKTELEHWKIYHKKNQEILLKVQKREAMWARLRELEAKASDPSRFVNRGGSLLKDQNMHNYIMKSLPKIEAELVFLSQKFEAEHGKKMKISGEEIPTMIEKEWKVFKEERSGRKTTGRTAPSPTKPMLQTIRKSVAPSSSMATMQPQIRPLEKRYGSKLELNLPPAPKRSKLQPLKAIQDEK